MWVFLLIGFGLVALAHTAPARFVLDANWTCWRAKAYTHVFRNRRACA